MLTSSFTVENFETLSPLKEEAQNEEIEELKEIQMEKIPEVSPEEPTQQPRRQATFTQNTVSINLEDSPKDIAQVVPFENLLTGDLEKNLLEEETPDTTHPITSPETPLNTTLASIDAQAELERDSIGLGPGIPEILLETLQKKGSEVERLLDLKAQACFTKNVKEKGVVIHTGHESNFFV